MSSKARQVDLTRVCIHARMQKDYDPIPFDKMHPSMLVSAACTLVQRLHTGLDQLRHLLMLDHLFMARMDLSLHSSYTANTKSSVLSQRRKIAYEMLVLPFSSNNSDFCALVPCNEYGSIFCRSEIYSADAMGYFTKMSIFNDAQLRVLGNKMAAELLVSGVGNDAETRYKKFRGRPVSTDHFVAHLNV